MMKLSQKNFELFFFIVCIPFLCVSSLRGAENLFKVDFTSKQPCGVFFVDSKLGQQVPGKATIEYREDGTQTIVDFDKADMGVGNYCLFTYRLAESLKIDSPIKIKCKFKTSNDDLKIIFLAFCKNNKYYRYVIKTTEKNNSGWTEIEFPLPDISGEIDRFSLHISLKTNSKEKADKINRSVTLNYIEVYEDEEKKKEIKKEMIETIQKAENFLLKKKSQYPENKRIKNISYNFSKKRDAGTLIEYLQKPVESFGSSSDYYSCTNRIYLYKDIAAKLSEQYNDSAVVFEYAGEDCNIKYLLKAEKFHTGEMELYYNNQKMSVFNEYAGGVLRLNDGVLLNECEAELKDQFLWSNQLVQIVAYKYKSASYLVEYRYMMNGKTLVITVEAEPNILSEYRLGIKDGKRVVIPYLNWTKIYRMGDCFYTCYFDYAESHMGYLVDISWKNTAVYPLLTDGNRNPFHEKIYLTLSPDIRECFPNNPHSPSKYKNELSPVIWLNDMYLLRDFENIQYAFKIFKDYGIDHVLFQRKQWQHYGWDAYPFIFPAAGLWGGDESMQKAITAAKNSGYYYCLHENYLGAFDFNNMLNEKDLILPFGKERFFDLQPGKPRGGYANNRFQMQMLNDRIKYYLKNYNQNATHIDITGSMPHYMFTMTTLDAEEQNAGMIYDNFQTRTNIMAALKNAFGPVTGEGNYSTLWTGAVDAPEGKTWLRTDSLRDQWFCLNTMEEIPEILDFSLLKVKPKATTFGFGGYYNYYRQTLNGDYSKARYSKYPENVFAFNNNIRSKQTAFGHNGYVEFYFLNDISFILRHYYMSSYLQKYFSNTSLAEISYYNENNKQYGDINDVIKREWPYNRIRLKYTNNLVIYINRSEEVWEIENKRLPEYGMLARLDGELVQYTALDKKNRNIDYLETKDVVFADPKTSVFCLNVKEIQNNILITPADFKFDASKQTLQFKLNIKVNEELKLPDLQHIQECNWNNKKIAVSGFSFEVVLVNKETDIHIFNPDPKTGNFPVRWGTAEYITNTDIFKKIGNYDLNITLPLHKKTRSGMYYICVNVGTPTLQYKYRYYPRGPKDPFERTIIAEGELKGAAGIDEAMFSATDINKEIFYNWPGANPRDLYDFDKIKTTGTVALGNRGEYLELIPIPLSESGQVYINDAEIFLKKRINKVLNSENQIVPVKRDGDFLSIPIDGKGKYKLYY
ncbi:hypothetical protein KKC91_04775 [bacterium]|nr:hypothetical protein [bacterium]